MQRNSHGFNTPPGGYDSEVALLLRALVGATHSHARLCFVRTNDPTASWLEGTVEVQVPPQQIRCAASVTKARGVIPTLAAAAPPNMMHGRVSYMHLCSLFSLRFLLITLACPLCRSFARILCHPILSLWHHLCLLRSTWASILNYFFPPPPPEASEEQCMGNSGNRGAQ
ncbi:hypothetical protein TraAM80_01658 [Trypanosoma rangeli]|uniref:Uncharacterized protein n=1 Tax=Trypanosoma rangeli TaxID=5698 RepID=A0A422NXS8_TRYRA|nr:uncharacterized protein TraAM80_01658 [Trypanosoma rangeli]RNF10219.1 hypothetical protein TraAM80_01658 [Trypanosoma rangeli]|eukprot:RNF10219.1 hypothetical protein TraAM80_01658 [Trypanosoma rangeli]